MCSQDPADPDLAQLLLREAGRLLEDLTPELAMRLPEQADERAALLRQALDTLDAARSLLEAASAVSEAIAIQHRA